MLGGNLGSLLYGDVSVMQMTAMANMANKSQRKHTANLCITTKDSKDFKIGFNQNGI